MRLTSLVTGASSGIGRVFADRLAARGYDITLVSRNKEKLEETAEDLRKYPVEIKVFPADLSRQEDANKVADYISQNGLDFLVNTAGFGVPGFIQDLEISQSLSMINLHVLAPTILCNAASRQMIKNQRGVIINVSSLASFIPGRGVYSATKSYLTVFSESLQKGLSSHRIKVQALCPRYVKTGFHSTEQYTGKEPNIPSWLWLTPEQVVDYSLKSLGKKRVVCIPGLKYQVIRKLAQIKNIF